MTHPGGQGRRGRRLLAPAMIERLNARARAEGLSTLLARTMDGHALDLDDDAFDVAVSVNGVSLFPTWRGALPSSSG